MTYNEYKKERQEELNRLPLMFAYNDSQLREAMEKRGLSFDKDGFSKIVKIANGCFCRKEDKEMVLNHFLNDRLPELIKNAKFAQSAFREEMDDHEYFINLQGDWEVCNIFIDCEYEDGKTGEEYLADAGYSQKVIDAFSAARRGHLRAFGR